MITAKVRTLVRITPTLSGSFPPSSTRNLAVAYDNDLTYFVLAHVVVIQQAIKALHTYIARKTAETRELDSHMRSVGCFNHRQAEIIRYALKHRDQRYTIESHQRSHDVTYQTARTDLLNLAANRVLEQGKRGRALIFTVPRNIEERLRKLEKKRPRS